MRIGKFGQMHIMMKWPKILIWPNLAMACAIVAGCSGDNAAQRDNAGDLSAEGEVLGGTISDAMIPVETVQSQSPTLRSLPSPDQAAGEDGDGIIGAEDGDIAGNDGANGDGRGDGAGAGNAPAAASQSAPANGNGPDGQ